MMGVEVAERMPSPDAPANWKPLVVCPDAELERRTSGAILEAGVTGAETAKGYLRPGEIAGIAARQRINICFLDVVSDQERASQLIAEISASMPVVALSPHKDADLILRCLRRGACEFLAAPAGDSVRGVFERLSRARTPQAGRKAALAYCVVPGKPGCGATTVAVHLALQMRAAGQVLLVDTDPMAGSIGFMLKLKSEFHLGDIVRDWKRMDEDLWSRLTAPFSGIDVVLAPETPTAKLEIGCALAGELLTFWKNRYAAVVLDAPDLRTAAESGFLAHADQIILVTTNELAALHATRRAVEFLELTIADRSRIRLVVNRYTPATGLKRDDLKAALQLEPFAVLSNDYDTVQEALLDGKPAAAGSRFRGSILALAQHLQGKPPAEKKSTSWRDLLHFGK
jgi:pilus assembly protein CpaE